MLAVFSPIFVVGTKIISYYNFVALSKSKIMIVSEIDEFNVFNTHLLYRTCKGVQT